MTPDYLLSNLEILKDDKKFLIDSLKSVIKSSLVKEFIKGNDRPCEISDFEDHLKYCENDTEALKLIFKNLTESNFIFESFEEKNISRTVDLDNELIILFCILCGENSSVKPWNTEAVVSNCSCILTNILKLYNYKNTTELFSKKFKGKLTKSMLELIRPKLLPSNWKNFPAAIISYKWILENIKQPELGSYLPLITPTSLLLVDDFFLENRILGIQCLNHIVLNVTSAELQFCGYGEVIFNALEPLLRIREANLINQLIPCLVNLSIKLEMDFGAEKKTKWSKFDCILEVYLENMEMEQVLDLRSTYIKYLELLIHSSGFNVVRWSKRLLRIFKEYLEVGVKHCDEITINYCLKAIQEFMKVSEKLIQIYAKDLFLIILGVHYTTIKNCKSNIQIENKDLTQKFIKDLFDKMSDNDQKNVTDEIKEKVQENDHFRHFYEEIKKCVESI